MDFGIDPTLNIRKSAVLAMGVCLLRNIELASHHLPLLFQIAHLDEV